MSYENHAKIFHEMKQAAGLTHIMDGLATKLRSFGAMAAADREASHPEIERAGRCYPYFATLAACYPCLRFSACYLDETLDLPIIPKVVCDPCFGMGRMR